MRLISLSLSSLILSPHPHNPYLIYLQNIKDINSIHFLLKLHFFIDSSFIIEILNQLYTLCI
jgi:hypothetical protein